MFYNSTIFKKEKSLKGFMFLLNIYEMRPKNFKIISNVLMK